MGYYIPLSTGRTGSESLWGRHWSCSSIGRASDCQSGGSGIETRQDRQFFCEPNGSGLSCMVHNLTSNSNYAGSNPVIPSPSNLFAKYFDLAVDKDRQYC